MSRFWLTYCDLSGRPVGVLILNSWSLAQARVRASIEGLEGAQLFLEGHELEGDSAALVPPDAVGRMLSREEAGKIVSRLERWIPKKPPATSTQAIRYPGRKSVSSLP